MKQTFVLADEQVRRRAMSAVQGAPIDFAVTVGPKTRTLEQNAAMWSILNAFSRQLQWPVNGSMQFITAEDYKEILSAAFHEEDVRVAAGLTGGVVMLGHHTSDFDKWRFSDFIDFLNAAATAKGVLLDET
jgi:hypothetical protein